MTAKARRNRSRWVDPDVAPELTGAELDRPDGVWSIGSRSVSRVRGRTAFRKMMGKKQLKPAQPRRIPAT